MVWHTQGCIESYDKAILYQKRTIEDIFDPDVFSWQEMDLKILFLCKLHVDVQTKSPIKNFVIHRQRIEKYAIDRQFFCL